jgi:hypothetical protein
MPPCLFHRTTLERLVRYIGESTKASTSWLNGQFGFGVHAFRAAADRLVVKTAHRADATAAGEGRPSTAACHRLEIGRLETSFSPATPSGPLDHASAEGTGTEVTLEGIDPQWGRELSAQDMVFEIEHHFERLLTRSDFTVTVREFRPTGNTTAAEAGRNRAEETPTGEGGGGEEATAVQCRPFDYAAVPGADFKRSLLHTTAAEGSEPTPRLRIHLKVATREYEGQRARVFLLGRRINEIGSIPSFIRQSKLKQQLWSHPQLVGYIEVDDIEPVITRDEFKQNQARETLYRELVGLEDKLWSALNEELERQKVISLGVIESVLGRALQGVVRGDKKSLREGFATISLDAPEGKGEGGSSAVVASGEGSVSQIASGTDETGLRAARHDMGESKDAKQLPTAQETAVGADGTSGGASEGVEKESRVARQRAPPKVAFDIGLSALPETADGNAWVGLGLWSRETTRKTQALCRQ